MTTDLAQQKSQRQLRYKPTQPNGCEAELLDHKQARQARQHEQRRWLLATVAVLVAYAGCLAWWLYTPRSTIAPSPMAGVMNIELTAAPMSPASEEDLPPALESTPEVTPKPEAKSQPEPKPETSQPPLLEPEVALPKPEPKPKPKLKPEPTPKPKPTPKLTQERKEYEQEEPTEQVSTASAPPVSTQAKTTAPNQGVSASLVQANRAPEWRDKLLMALNVAKRYPRRARRLHQEGISYLSFIMDREGNVLKYRVTRSSGYKLLDQETRDLIQRAQPLPKPPENVEGATLEFVVPIKFSLRP